MAIKNFISLIFLLIAQFVIASSHKTFRTSKSYFNPQARDSSLGIDRELAQIKKYAKKQNKALRPGWEEMIRGFKPKVTLKMLQHYHGEHKFYVRYPSDQELTPMQIYFIDGKAYDPHMKLIDNTDERPLNKDTGYLFVLRRDGTAYATHKKRLVWQHSSLCQGRDIAHADMIQISKGRLIKNNLHSGHFRPNSQSYQNLLSKIQLSKDIFETTEQMHKSAQKIQALSRSYLSRKKASQTRPVLVIQRFVRKSLAKKYFKEKNNSKKEQSKNLRNLLRRRNKSATIIQNLFRQNKAKKILKEKKELKKEIENTKREIRRQRRKNHTNLVLSSFCKFFLPFINLDPIKVCQPGQSRVDELKIYLKNLQKRINSHSN